MWFVPTDLTRLVAAGDDSSPSPRAGISATCAIGDDSDFIHVWYTTAHCQYILSGKVNTMRRTLLSLVALTLLLSACAAQGDTKVDLPPQATKIAESTNNAKIDALLAQWKQGATEQFKADAVKTETIEENVYSTSSTLADVQTYYNSLMAKGWVPVKKMTNTKNDQVLLLGYEHGTTSLVIGAVDASKLGGSGVVVFTLKGNK
jgi:hypothetical protein